MDYSCYYLCSELTTVIYEGHPGELHQTIANLEEISTTCAKILLDGQPRLGSAISLTVKGHDLFGQVLSRSYDSTLGWFVTVRLDAKSVWRKKWFSPQHLLAVGPCAVEQPAWSMAFTLESPQITEENALATFLTSGS
jgi:hypothetical protein